MPTQELIQVQSEGELVGQDSREGEARDSQKWSCLPGTSPIKVVV